MRRTQRARRGSRRLWGRAVLGAGLCLGLSVGMAEPASAESCTPWPGEPQPLPGVADRDAPRARWAELRVQELSARAERAEAAAPLEAHQLWQRVLCFDSASARAAAGVARTRPVRVYRPEVKIVRQPAAERGSRELAKLLAAPIPVHVAARTKPKPDVALAAAQRRLIERVETLLGETEARLRRARFEEALESAQEARSRLSLVTSQGERRAREARLEVLTATAQLALGEDRAARESLGRAIAADPDLELDPMKTSPKVIRALAAVRAQREARR